LRITNIGKTEPGCNKVFPCEPIPAFDNKRCHFFVRKELDAECNAVVRCGYADAVAEAKRNSDQDQIKILKARIAENERKIAEQKKKAKKGSR
jgi:hypothetical protein